MLRRHHYCIVCIPKDTVHKHIHNSIPFIPPPREITAGSALEQLALLERFGGISQSDPIEKRLLVLAALFDCVDQATADAFRKQLEIVREFNKKAPP